MMSKYRSKLIEIDAIEWDGTNEDSIYKFVKDRYYISVDGALMLLTKEGDVKVNIGDFIVKEFNEDFFVCSSDLFYKKYEVILQEKIKDKEDSKGKQVAHETTDGDIRYSGFWSGFGDQ